MHQVTGLKVLYFGTPVVIISSRNPDGSTNLAPMSSAWWLNQSCLLGMGHRSQTTANLLRERECVLNLAPSSLVDAVDRLAMTTGVKDVHPAKANQGYRYVPDKFGIAGLTSQPSDLVAPLRVKECPIQLECTLVDSFPLDGCTTFHVTVQRAHVEENLLIPGTAYVDPIAWDPLIMKFCEFFGGGQNVYPSRLAQGWQLPHSLDLERTPGRTVAV